MKTERTNSDAVCDLLNGVPRTGGGVHNWLFRTALTLQGHLPPDLIVDMLRERVAHCGRHVPEREVVAAVRNSQRIQRQGSRACSSVRESPVSVSTRGDSADRVSLRDWRPETGDSRLAGAINRPRLDPALRESVTRSPGACGLADLWERSPVRLDTEGSLAESVVDLFFPGNPYLCCGSGPTRFDTRRREEWRGQLTNLALIVPSPMTAPTGLTQDGRPSRHTLANTGSRRFLICEFDQGNCQEHAALLWHLGNIAPLVCAVHSGGKSLHGWFYVQHFSEEQAHRFFRQAIRLGADPATWTRSQFVRLPDGWRPGSTGENRASGKRQTIFYLNPQPLEKKSL